MLKTATDMDGVRGNYRLDRDKEVKQCKNGR